MALFLADRGPVLTAGAGESNIILKIMMTIDEAAKAGKTIRLERPG